MTVYISLIALYSIFVAVSVYFLGSIRLFANNINIKSLLVVFLDFSFWLGLFFALLARLTFIITNSHLSKLPVTQNASTSITFIVTLSSIVAVVILNYFLLKDRLTVNQLIGSMIILLGVLWMFR